MLQLSNIRKAYTTGSFTQVALDDVSVALRDNEFAAILGPSGSGKTTLLNILGGLDHADSGDIVINGVSTADYTDKDWDAYRNHRIGFIFQSYNLIPHQTILANVELALTLAGVGASERHSRALAALGRVGLAEHADKRPNQLSGGQMQRVAIARALVNDPDIVLADEPTGALDTDTGIQVMDLLAEIARDRLVVMVTHNPELAEEYATRIITLRDGRIVDDTDPYLGEAEHAGSPAHMAAAPMGAIPLADARRARTGAVRPGTRESVSDSTRHASMSFLTALALSFNNLMTKKGRTFMTAFAGSIGIIGIAAILALSNGVNDYIARTEEEALSSYPLTITKSSFDLTSMMVANMDVDGSDKDEPNGLEQVIDQRTVMGDMFAKVKNNDLRAFRAWIESGESGIEPYVNSIQYSYGINPIIYKADTSAGVIKLNPSRMGSTLTNGLAGSAFLGGSSMSSFTELLDDRKLIEQSLDLVEGRLPEEYDECVLVLGRRGGITDYTLYSLGVYDIRVMDDMLTKALAGEEVDVPKTRKTFTRKDAMNLHFAVVSPTQLYRKNEGQGTWTDMTSDKAYMRRLLADDAIDLHVVGIVRQSDNASSSGVPEGIAYTPALTLRLMKMAQDSQIVTEQKARPDVDVFTGKTFDELADEESSKFSLEDAFEVDEEALSSAFTFDASALENLGQGMDLSGLDLSSLGNMDMSGMDFSDLDLSSAFSDLDLSSLQGSFDQEEFSQGMQKALEEALGDQMQQPAQLSSEQLAALAGAVGKLANGFADYLEEQGVLETNDGQLVKPDLAALMQAYLALPETQETLNALVGSLGDLTAEDAQAVTNLVTNYLNNELVPYMQAALSDLDPASIDADTLSNLIAGAPQIDPSQIGSALGADAIREVVADAGGKLSADFVQWLLDNPSLILGEDAQGKDSSAYGDLVNTYLATDSAKAILAEAASNLVGDSGGAATQAISDAIAKYLSGYMGTIAEQMKGSITKAFASAGEQMGKLIAAKMVAGLSAAMGQMGTQLGSAISGQMAGQMEQLSSALEGAFTVDGEAFASAIKVNMTEEDMASLLTNLMNAEELSYESNLDKLGFAEQENPESISIYPIDFPAKESVLDIVDGYNERKKAEGDEDSTIQYSDIAGVLMSSVTDIVNTISLVLIAFVSISLVVSSIMIAIITYVSVLERKKEIGILRAMGASKLNVANVFNAETVIEGLIAGLMAVIVVYAASVPVNEIVYRLKDVPNIMQLPLTSAAALVGISVALTLVAGLIPSSAAARRDPVEALRSE